MSDDTLSEAFKSAYSGSNPDGSLIRKAASSTGSIRFPSLSSGKRVKPNRDVGVDRMMEDYRIVSLKD
jgi:hypothetical protein